MEFIDESKNTVFVYAEAMEMGGVAIVFDLQVCSYYSEKSLLMRSPVLTTDFGIVESLLHNGERVG